YLAVGDRDLALGLAPVVGPALFAGHAPLVTGQVLGLALQVARVRNRLAVGERGEALHSKVHTDLAPSLRNRVRVLGLHREGHVEAPVRLARDHHHRGVERVQVYFRPGPRHLQGPGLLGQEQAPAADAERAAG